MSRSFREWAFFFVLYLSHTFACPVMTVMNHFSLDLAWRSPTSWPHAVFCEDLSLSLENGSLNSMSHGEPIHLKLFAGVLLRRVPHILLMMAVSRFHQDEKRVLMLFRHLHWFLIDMFLVLFFSLIRFVMQGAFVWTGGLASGSTWQTRAQFHWQKPGRHRWL